MSFQIENAGKTDLLEIKEELINSGYLKKDKNKKENSQNNEKDSDKNSNGNNGNWCIDNRGNVFR